MKSNRYVSQLLADRKKPENLRFFISNTRQKQYIDTDGKFKQPVKASSDTDEGTPKIVQVKFSRGQARARAKAKLESKKAPKKESKSGLKGKAKVKAKAEVRKSAPKASSTSKAPKKA